jgi:hypothetical protein
VIQRRSFDLADLTRLLASPIYGTPRAAPLGGGGAAAFWLPLIALFAGARAEEIGQLLTAGVKHQHGVDFFDITTLDDDDDDSTSAKKGTDKALKTPAGKRRTPIHQTLIDIGFLDHVAERRRKGDVRLLPELIGHRDRYTKNWSRWCGRYQDKYVADPRPARIDRPSCYSAWGHDADRRRKYSIVTA